MARAIITKYMPATNNKGSRIQVKSWLGTKYYPYEHAAQNAHAHACVQWLGEHGYEYKLVCQDLASMPDGSGYVFIVE